MNDPLQLPMLEAISAGHRTLDALSMALRVPAAEVDSRIRAAIAQSLVVATQKGETWTFALTDAGQRTVASRAGGSRIPGMSGLLGELRAAQGRPRGTGFSGPPARTVIQMRKRPVAPPRSMLTPMEEAALAERQAWSFAFAVVGAVVVVALVIWLLLGAG